MLQSEKITEKKAEILLRVCAMLMTAGANTSRILLIINRFSEVLNTDAQLFIDHKAFIITITDAHTNKKTTQLKRLPPHAINFSTLSAISQASRDAQDKNWQYNRIETELNKIELIKHYPKIIILISVGLAGSGFCNLFGGDFINMIITFFATIMGLFSKQLAHKKEFNPYFAAFIGALVAAFFASSALFLQLSTDPHIAVATSVLFLIPGVPLINSFTDMIDGYMITGASRFLNGLVFVMAIALALSIVLYLFSIKML